MLSLVDTKYVDINALAMPKLLRSGRYSQSCLLYARVASGLTATFWQRLTLKLDK